MFQDEPIAVTAVKSQGDQDTRFTEIEETYAVTLTFPRGRIAQFIASFGADQTDVMTVVGTKGALEMSPGYQFQYGYSIKHRVSMDIVETPFDQVDHFGGQVAYFSDCIISKIEPESNGQEGLLDMEIMIAVERAAATGKSVALNLERRDRRPPLGKMPGRFQLRKNGLFCDLARALIMNVQSNRPPSIRLIGV